MKHQLHAQIHLLAAGECVEEWYLEENLSEHGVVLGKNHIPVGTKIQ